MKSLKECTMSTIIEREVPYDCIPKCLISDINIYKSQLYWKSLYKKNKECNRSIDDLELKEYLCQECQISIIESFDKNGIARCFECKDKYNDNSNYTTLIYNESINYYNILTNLTIVIKFKYNSTKGLTSSTEVFKFNIHPSISLNRFIQFYYHRNMKIKEAILVKQHHINITINNYDLPLYEFIKHISEGDFRRNILHYQLYIWI